MARATFCGQHCPVEQNGHLMYKVSLQKVKKKNQYTFDSHARRAGHLGVSKDWPRTIQSVKSVDWNVELGGQIVDVGPCSKRQNKRRTWMLF